MFASASSKCIVWKRKFCPSADTCFKFVKVNLFPAVFSLLQPLCTMRPRPVMCGDGLLSKKLQDWRLSHCVIASTSTIEAFKRRKPFMRPLLCSGQWRRLRPPRRAPASGPAGRPGRQIYDVTALSLACFGRGLSKLEQPVSL